MREPPLDEVRMSLGDLPAVLPVFPLSGAILLPRGRLSLNVFEPRYRNLVEDSLGLGRMFGMIQPRVAEEIQMPDETPPDQPALYQVGCAGRIVSFQETEDGRFLLQLLGLCRFRVGEELALSDGGYRRLDVQYEDFATDFDKPKDSMQERSKLEKALKPYFLQHGIDAQWELIKNAPDEALINTLCAVCPFQPAEKQALLEAPDLNARCQTMVALLEMGLTNDKQGGGHG